MLIFAKETAVDGRIFFGEDNKTVAFAKFPKRNDEFA
jgi:hypothetical protein